MTTRLQTLLLTMTLLLGLGGASIADARPTAHFGTPHSFKGGFSSSRGATASGSRAAAPAPSGNRQFGGFGSAKPAAPAVPAPQQSALSKNLDQNAANANALRTLDARRAAAAPAPPAAPVAAVPPAPHQYGGPAPVPAPVVVVQQRSGMGDMFMGFMLARSMSGGHATAAVQGTGTGTGAVPAAADAGGSSFGAIFLRTFLWLLIFGAIGWSIWFARRRFKRARQDSAPNYAFERE